MFQLVFFCLLYCPLASRTTPQTRAHVEWGEGGPYHRQSFGRIKNNLKYDQLQVLSDVVAREVNVLKIDVPAEGGRGWKRTFSEISTQDDELGKNWNQQISQGAKYVLQETWVKANEPHYAPTLAGQGNGAVNVHAEQKYARVACCIL